MRLIENVQDILKALKVDCSIEENTDKEDLESRDATEEVSLDRGTVNITKAKIEIDALGEKKKVNGYLAWLVVVTPQTYWEPEDADVIEIASSVNFREVVMKAVNAVLDRRVDILLEQRMFCEGDWY